jgi:hypothetical protein
MRTIITVTPLELSLVTFLKQGLKVRNTIITNEKNTLLVL